MNNDIDDVVDNVVGDRNQSQEQLLREMKALHQEVSTLKISQSALNMQNEILQKAVALVETDSSPAILKDTLKAILDIIIRITGAEESSIFLVDDEGTVIEGILASSRGEVEMDRVQMLIGKVLHDGLAGFVLRHRTVSLITDTNEDPHWIQLANQPYTARSAIGAPLLYSSVALGVLTLMHSQPNHFTDDDATLIRMSHDQIALIIENARLHAGRWWVGS